jgi:hypothetical protein
MKAAAPHEAWLPAGAENVAIVAILGLFMPESVCPKLCERATVTGNPAAD